MKNAGRHYAQVVRKKAYFPVCRGKEECSLIEGIKKDLTLQIQDLRLISELTEGHQRCSPVWRLNREPFTDTKALLKTKPPFLSSRSEPAWYWVCILDTAGIQIFFHVHKFIGLPEMP
ncbi:uncharacterized protein LOC129754960 [Uranotaenia lowii]|uniref:uncharacterized protein LOC129750719 n=1 Tax=Uranotaenia lowii TaxID=190385 RepID=UPI0024797DBF|nr:uncharacterized protein LOC129750719 [Uranotaenia lowii]XP_055607206.1 uncharacterized protein LOC129754960 [Uranotaenia lowii]